MSVDLSKSILSPFRRDKKRDFASGSGMDLLKSKVIQVLATEGATPRSSGELKWRTELGSGLHLLKHQRNDDILAELARVYVRDAFKRWLPEAVLVDLDVTRDVEMLHLRVRFQEAGGVGSKEVGSVETDLLFG